jgi:hypothetical protein
MYTHGHYLKVKTIILDSEWSKDAIGSKLLSKLIFFFIIKWTHHITTLEVITRNNTLKLKTLH